jgi:hypothetical protein
VLVVRSDASKSLSYGRDDRGIVISFPGWGDFFVLLSFQRGFGANSTTYSKGIGGSLSGMKKPRSETDHSPPFSAQVKN